MEAFDCILRISSRFPTREEEELPRGKVKLSKLSSPGNCHSTVLGKIELKIFSGNLGHLWLFDFEALFFCQFPLDLKTFCQDFKWGRSRFTYPTYFHWQWCAVHLVGSSRHTVGAWCFCSLCYFGKPAKGGYSWKTYLNVTRSVSFEIDWIRCNYVPAPRRLSTDGQSPVECWINALLIFRADEQSGIYPYLWRKMVSCCLQALSVFSAWTSWLLCLLVGIYQNKTNYEGGPTSYGLST